MNENQNQEQQQEQELPQEMAASEPSQVQPEAVQTAAKPRKKMSLLAAAAIIMVAAAAAIWAFGGSHRQQMDAQEHLNPTSVAYTADGKVGIVRDQQTVDLYVNGAKGGNREMINQIMSGSIPYAGEKNYVELDNGDRVYVRMEILSITHMNGKLCVRTADGEEKVLDENVSSIYCNSDNAVYYTKTVDNKQVQLRYQDGQVTPIQEVVGKENIAVTSVSQDGTLMQVIQRDENQNTIASGYFYEDQLHLLDSNRTVFQIAPIGKEVFVMETHEDTGLVDLYRVKDLATAELEPIGSGVTEAVVYEDGSMSFVGDADVSANEYNPVGSIYLYSHADASVEKLADNAVAILESQMRSNGWMNENGRDVTTSEISRDFSRDAQLWNGQVHYIDAQGNLCASSAQAATVGESGLQGFVISENFYQVNDYSFNDEIVFATYAQDCLYWSRGADLYRYHLGSMEQPDVIPLNESVEDKAEQNEIQVGYITSGSGDIIEESQQALILKKFKEENSVTLLENVGELSLAGLDNDGSSIFFTSEDGSLYEKSVKNRSNPKLIASGVLQAQATSDGLYYLLESKPQVTIGASGEEETQEETKYDLMLRPYGRDQSQLIAQDVNGISAIYIGK